MKQLLFLKGCGTAKVFPVQYAAAILNCFIKKAKKSDCDLQCMH